MNPSHHPSPMFMLPAITAFEQMPLRELIRAHLACPVLEPLQHHAFRNRRELTLLIGGSAAAETLMYRSALFAPMEDYLVDYQRGVPLGTGPRGWLTERSRVDVQSPGVLTSDISNWLAICLPSITTLQLVADIRSMTEHEAKCTVAQICFLLRQWAPQLRRLSLWLAANAYFDWDRAEWISELTPIWLEVNACGQLTSLSVDLLELTPKGAVPCLRLSVPLTILEQLSEFNFASDSVYVWDQITERQSNARLGLQSSYHPIEELLQLDVKLTTRFTSMGVCEIDSPDQLTTLLEDRFHSLTSLALRCDYNPEFTFASLIPVLATATVTKLHQLTRLQVSVGHVAQLFTIAQLDHLKHFLPPSGALHSIKSLTIEKDYMMTHFDTDLDPLPDLFPALQTLLLAVKLPLCLDCGPQMMLPCAHTILRPMQRCQTIRRLAIKLGTDAFYAEFAPNQLACRMSCASGSGQRKPHVTHPFHTPSTRPFIWTSLPNWL